MQPAARVSAVLLLLWASSAVAATKGAGGMICIAAFKPASTDDGPNMSPETWGPSANSVFTFKVGRQAPVAVHSYDAVSIKDVPTDRRVLVRVQLDGRPFESFWIDLRKEPDQRVCLRLYRGYWHWIDSGWKKNLGCTCK